MEQPERALEEIDQVAACDFGCRRICTFLEIQPRLDQFDVPVAEFAPEEIVDAVCGLVETIDLKGVINILRYAVEAGKYPAVFKRLRREPIDTRVGLRVILRGA